MKFGVCKFGKMPNVGPKDRERWQRIKLGALAQDELLGMVLGCFLSRDEFGGSE